MTKPAAASDHLLPSTPPRRPPPPPPPTALLLSFFFFLHLHCFTSAHLPHQVSRGFSAHPSSNPPPPLSSSSSLSFQPILADPTGIFFLGFLLLPSSSRPPDLLLHLAVVHLPSALPVWRAAPAAHARWSDSASLFFNGSLILSDPTGSVLWSAGGSPSASGGDRLVLLNSSNLQIQKLSGSVVWQSFDSPFDTLVQGQNLTPSAALFSADRRYSMRLSPTYVALYMAPNAVMYWKVTAMEEKAQIVEGAGPIYARVDPLGFLGLYQNETSRVHLMAFDTFNRGIPGFRRLTLETDGNLRAYYWVDGAHGGWVLEFTAISNVCGLPAHCGAYGVCNMANGDCGCLLDEGRTGSDDECLPADSGDLCGDQFWELRRAGVELPYQDLQVSQKVGSREECERGCRRNCSCRGALYNNATGICHRMDFPVETLLATGDRNRVGYFKVRNAISTTGGGKEGKKKERLVGLVAVLVVGLPVFAGVAMFGAYRMWEYRRRAGGDLVGEGISSGAYKEFRNSGSFREIELSVPSSSSAAPTRRP